MRELDYGVGVILKLLTQLGVASDTLVIFSSDNGGATYAKEMGMCIYIQLMLLMQLFLRNPSKRSDVLSLSR